MGSRHLGAPAASPKSTMDGDDRDRSRRGRRQAPRRPRGLAAAADTSDAAGARPDPLGDVVGRFARTHGPFTRRRRRGRPRPADRRRHRGARTGSPVEGRVSAGRLPSRRRGPGVGRHRGAAPAATSLAGRAARRGRSRRPEVRPVPPGVARHRQRTWPPGTLDRGRPPTPGRGPPGEHPRGRRPRRPGWTTSPGCSTSCSPRARWCGSGRGPLGANDGRVALYLRDQVPLLHRPIARSTRPTARSTTCSAITSSTGRLVLPRPLRRRRGRDPRTPCSRRCGTWCGPAR